MPLGSEVRDIKAAASESINTVFIYRYTEFGGLLLYSGAQSKGRSTLGGRGGPDTKNEDEIKITFLSNIII